MKHAVIWAVAGLTLATMAGPAIAQPVTYPVDLFYEPVIDGPRPIKTIRITMRATSPKAAETMCNNFTNMQRLSRNVLEWNAYELNLRGKWYGAGGECIRDKHGNIEMTVEASSGGSN